jgi:hypothetical protein
MPRVTEITVPPDQTATLLQRVKDIPQLVSIRVEKGISVQPPGDVVTVTVTDRSLPQLFHLLDELGITRDAGSSVTTSRPMGLISPSSAQAIRNDASHFTWEEMDQELNKESGMSPGSMATMAIAGLIAAAGLMTNALHLVIGAMVIAPGFEPISRVALGIVSRGASWRRGFADFLKGYLSLLAGAAVAAIILQQWGYGPASTQGTYLPQGALLSYWTSLSPTSLLVSAAAATAGALLVIGQRAVLTAGVMIALALIPAATMLGIGLATMDMNLITTGSTRLVIELLMVGVLSILVFAAKRGWIEKRRTSA